MTSRRALFNGAHAARLLAILATLRGNGGSAALVVAGSLLLPACAVPSALAATRVNHTHHATAPSAGRAQAHLVHDEELRASHSSSKTASRKDRHAAEPSRASAAHRSTEASHYARNSGDTRRASKMPAKTRSGHKRHEPEPIDDPQPVRRADARHGKQELPRESPRGRSHEAYIEAASHGPSTWNAHPSDPLHTSTRFSSTRLSQADLVAEERASTPAPGALVVLPVRNGIPGNVARNLARRASQGRAVPASPASPAGSGPETENLTGISRPDDDERLPMRSDIQPSALSTAARRQAAAVATLARPSAALLTASAPSAQSSAGAIEGFGSEVDFRAPAIQLANRPTPIAPPQGTPAEQALELREAAEAASKPMFVPLYNRDGKLVIPPPLKGSRDILVHQNQMADDAGLTRIQDDADLARMRRAHLLVDLEETASLRVNEGLPVNRRSARPWAVRFANDVANAFYKHFGEALQVNSAVRTVAYQLRLQRTNGNAAAIDGEGASPHLTGQAIDFGKRGMTVAEIAWMRSYLVPLIEAGKIDVEEEFQQACFHISVYSSYVPATRKRGPARTELAQARRPTHIHATADDNDDMR